MEIKVKSLDSMPEKSAQEVEEKLLKNHENEISTDAVEKEPVEQVVEQDSTVESPTIKDEDVLSYIKNRYNKDISSVDDLFAEREQSESLPEDVSKYLDYKKNTGRGFEDFVKINKNYDDLNEDQVLSEYYSLTESDLDNEDIRYLMDEKFSYDEEIDDENEIKKKNIAKKRELSKAKKYLNDVKEQYKIPLESSGSSLSEDQQKDIDDDGLISNAKGWHTALSAAMDPQRFANYFYEQGKADAIEDVTKKSKNINMSMRQTPQAIGDTGFKARPVSDTSGKGLKIRSKKNS